MPLSQPPLNDTPFAQDSEFKNTIPKTTDIKGAASFLKGFPYPTMVSKIAGGVAPSGWDFNGLFHQLSSHQVWLNAGGQYKFNAELANAIGGYHKGAQLISDDGLRLYVSTIDGNTNNLNNNLTGWALFGTSEFENILQAERDARIYSDNLLNNKIDLKYDKTGGTVSGNVSITGNLNIANTIFQGNYLGNQTGFTTLMNGLILQWGQQDYSSNPGELDVNVQFPIAFPNACLNVSATRMAIANTPNGDGGILLISRNKINAQLSVQVFNGDSTSGLRGFTWMAIGN